MLTSRRPALEEYLYGILPYRSVLRVGFYIRKLSYESMQGIFAERIRRRRKYPLHGNLMAADGNIGIEVPLMIEAYA